jgi:NAD(P)-dependent dehydrogenase (short-subunit alcohol dehydrogenase family)
MAKWTVSEIPSLQGTLSVVTGANSGIGWHTALELARAGSEVVLTVRSDVKGLDAAARICREVPDAKVRHELLDLASLPSVRTFASKLGNEPKIDILVNNAGIMSVPTRRVTGDGFELQLGTNYLGPFALTALLLPALLRAESPRVTTVSSGAANMGMRKINFDDFNWEKSYHPWKAYCQSKLADLIFSEELGRRYGVKGHTLLSTAAHPGYTVTNLQTSGPGKEQSVFGKLFALVLAQDVAGGALPTLRAATEPNASEGSYYGPAHWFGLKGDPIPINVPEVAQDQAAATRLWELSERLTGVLWPDWK